MESIKNNLAIFQEGKAGKQPIIFIHGFPFDHLMWKRQIDSLKDEYFCISYDIRGLGQSPAGDGQYTIEMFADDLESIIDSLQQKPVVCGLSMGGYILFRAAERFQEKMKAVIFCDTKSEADNNAGKIKRAEGLKKVKEEGVEVFVEGFLPNCFLPSNINSDIYNEILRRSRNSSPIGVIGCLLAMAGRTDTSDSLQNINIPALLLCGAEDKLTPPEVMAEVSRRIPGSEFYVVEKAAHMAPVENPGFVNEKIKEFLRKNID